MRRFFQKKPQADFFLSAKNTVAVRKDAIEYIFKTGNGWYSVINLTITDKAVILIACLGNILPQIDKVLNTLGHDPDDVPTFLSMIDGESEYTLTFMSKTGKDQIIGITKNIYRAPQPWIQVMGDIDIIKEVGKMNDSIYKVYNELRSSKTKEMQSLCNYFVDK